MAPTGQEIWYDQSTVFQAYSPMVDQTNINRYSRKYRIKLKDSSSVVASLGLRDLYPENREDDEFFYVAPRYAYRPDLVAYDMYGTMKLYWVILSANGMRTPFELRPEMTIRVPTLASLYDVGGVMSR